MAPVDLLEGIADLPDRSPRPSRVDGERQQIAVTSGCTAGQGDQGIGTRLWIPLGP